MSPAQRKRLATQCRQAAHEVFAAVNRNIGAELLSLDLPMGQFKAMAIVTMYGSQPVGEIGRRLGISEPAASLLVGKLEERGLAARVRDEEDRRRTLVTATPAGDELARACGRAARSRSSAGWPPSPTPSWRVSCSASAACCGSCRTRPQTVRAPRGAAPAAAEAVTHG